MLVSSILKVIEDCERQESIRENFSDLEATTFSDRVLINLRLDNFRKIFEEYIFTRRKLATVKAQKIGTDQKKSQEQNNMSHTKA